MVRRRQFLACASSVLAAPAFSADKIQAPAKYANRLQLEADGPTAFNFVVFDPDIQLNLPPIDAPMEVRVRSLFPYQGRDLLYTLVYVANANDPDHNVAFPISEFVLQVDKIDIGAKPANTLGFFGTVVSNPVQSPFGDIVGRVASMGCQFTEGDPASFEFFGGYVAGSHATFVPAATGKLVIRAPWQSF